MTPLPDGYRQGIAFADLLIAIRTLARAWAKHSETLPTHHGLHSIPRAIHYLSACE